MESSLIETGVDKLVELVKKKGKISFADAARELGVSGDVISEWSEFLDEEGIVGIEYKFTTPYLTERKISKVELDKKAREFTDKKELFVRKAEGTVSVLQREAENMTKMKGEFDRLKKDLGIDLDSVRKELSELESLEKEKEDLAKKLLEEKAESKKRTDDLASSIERERKKYTQLLSEISSEESSLQKEKATAASLEQKEKSLLLQLVSLKNLIKDIEEKVAEEDTSIRNSKTHIEKLNQMATQMRESLKSEKDALEPLLLQKEQREKEIKIAHEKILSKILKSEGTKEKKEASKKLKSFFEDKLKVSTLVEKLNEDRTSLEVELSSLVKKAKAFQLTSKGKDLQKEIEELEGKFKQMEEKKSVFEEKFRQLTKLIKLG